MKLARVADAGGILAALAVGLAVGALAGRLHASWLTSAQAVAATIGGLWVDALKMTIVPLIASLIVTSVATRGGAAEGRISGKAVLLFAVLLAMSGLIGMAIVPPMFAGHHAAVTAAAVPLEVPPIPSVSEWLRALVPTNIVAAAAEDRIIGVVLFALLFGAAAARIEPDKRDVLLRWFEALRDAMLMLVGWILLLAPIGVAALAFVAASGDVSGLAGIAFLYVASQVIVSVAVMAATVAVVVVARRRIAARFVRASGGPLALALGSRSSIACLPSMIGAADAMGLERSGAATVLSLAVSLFKLSSPGTIIGTIAALAAIDGHHLSLAQVAIVAGMGVVSTLSVAGLPGAVSFFAVMIPAAQVAGVPVTYLPLLLAVEAFGDMARTACNVLGDLAAAALLVPIEPHGEVEQ
ncbi:MAG: dicarboxylate/amino acid:cation symporter [Sphingomicrobium sp.]|nr:dicarboxylate/amino acid:cation symporter [Sphingomonadales bacterium]